MKLDRSTQKPALWKPFPYAIAPTVRGKDLIYTLGITRERLVGIFLFSCLTVSSVVMSIYVVQKQGMNGTIPYRSGNMPVEGMLLITAFLVVINLWLLFQTNRQSQVVVTNDKVQIQYRHKRNSTASVGEIVIRSAQLSNGKRSGSGAFYSWVLNKIERNEVHLTMIRTETDFEIIGAFKNIDSAIDFAEIVQSETGLEVVDLNTSDLYVIVGHRSYGFGSSDSRAIKRRFQSRPFN